MRYITYRRFIKPMELPLPTTTEVQTAKHTPGPWSEIYGTIEAAGGMVICTLTGSDDFPCLTEDEDKTEEQVRAEVDAECAANAKLIAAAPALLAALVAFMPELEQRERFISANDSPWSQSERDMLNRISAARKAVKDAGGEA